MICLVWYKSLARTFAHESKKPMKAHLNMIWAEHELNWTRTEEAAEKHELRNRETRTEEHELRNTNTRNTSWVWYKQLKNLNIHQFLFKTKICETRGKKNRLCNVLCLIKIKRTIPDFSLLIENRIRGEFLNRNRGGSLGSNTKQHGLFLSKE